MRAAAAAAAAKELTVCEWGRREKKFKRLLLNWLTSRGCYKRQVKGSLHLVVCVMLCVCKRVDVVEPETSNKSRREEEAEKKAERGRGKAERNASLCLSALARTLAHSFRRLLLPASPPDKAQNQTFPKDVLLSPSPRQPGKTSARRSVRRGRR